MIKDNRFSAFAGSTKINKDMSAVHTPGKDSPLKIIVED